MESAGGFVPVAPVIAVSDHVVIAGLEAASVEAAIKRSGTSSSELANSQNYVNAASRAPGSRPSLWLHRYRASLHAV